MRTIQRALLWLVTGAIPVVIAACYGVVMEFYKPGRVLDKATQKGIPDVEVHCADAAEDAGPAEDAADTDALAITDAEGSFVLGADPGCSTLRFVDVDGDANGGLYAPVEAPLGDNGAELTVEMELQG